MNRHFEEIYCRSSESPVLCLEYNGLDDELITGGVSNIRIWKLAKVKRTSDGFGITGIRIIIDDLKVEE